ncbi:MAG: hypothetical protein JXL80_07155 [Planctomycetes bacterium]|nr:hypothetical protein [Planctomycetota bacterium]
MIRKMKSKLQDKYRASRLFRWATDLVVVVTIFVLITVVHSFLGGMRNVFEMFGAIRGG